MATVYSFHTGRPLNLWERCCLQSFADHGNRMSLFAYNALETPPGVTLEDAGTIISQAEYDAFMARAPGAFASFSDLFRYELLYRRGGWWVDTDVVCLSALPAADFWVGRIGEHVANAIMKVPADHPMLAELVSYCRSHIHLIGADRCSFGPSRVPGFAERHDLFAIDLSGMFPFNKKTLWMLGEPQQHESCVRAAHDAPTIHLFQDRAHRFRLDRNSLPPRGSYLADLFQGHGGDCAVHMHLSEWRKAWTVRKKRKSLLAKAGGLVAKLARVARPSLVQTTLLPRR